MPSRCSIRPASCPAFPATMRSLRLHLRALPIARARLLRIALLVLVDFLAQAAPPAPPPPSPLVPWAVLFAAPPAAGAARSAQKGSDEPVSASYPRCRSSRDKLSPLACGSLPPPQPLRGCLHGSLGLRHAWEAMSPCAGCHATTRGAQGSELSRCGYSRCPNGTTSHETAAKHEVHKTSTSSVQKTNITHRGGPLCEMIIVKPRPVHDSLDNIDRVNRHDVSRQAAHNYIYPQSVTRYYNSKTCAPLVAVFRMATSVAQCKSCALEHHATWNERRQRG